MIKMSKEKFLLDHLTAKEAQEAFKKRHIALFPIGAVHKHGDVPIGIDNQSAEEVARRIGERIPDKVIVLPLLPYGVSSGVNVLPGGINTAYAPVRDMVRDVCLSVVKHGITHILFLSGHGGNPDALIDVGGELHKYGVLSAVVQWYVLIRELKGEQVPDYQSVFNTEPAVSAALGLVDDISVLRTGEVRLPTLHAEILGDKFTPIRGYPRYGVLFEGGSAQIPLPRVHVDLSNPEPGVWDSIADKVSAERGEDILNTCVDWFIKFLAEFEKKKIPKEYIDSLAIESLREDFKK
jgi:creatinine amidohydrolase